MPKILLLDIETAPNTAYVWGLFKQNISISQVVDSSSVLCWAAKWLGDEEVMFDSVVKSGRKRMLKRIHKLLEQCDAVVHYNGTRFDIPTLNKEFLEASMLPPAPYQQVDLLRTARRQFRFPSNKLDYVARALNLGQKEKHEGFELWIKCMQKDPDAWERMEKYNKQDVVLLEAVYNRFLPWIKNHPNHGLYNESVVCSSCGSQHLQRRGYSVSTVGKYQRYQCNGCGSWSQERVSEGVAATMLKGCV
jgi:DNA polymerase elongation subunit (family B)